MQKITLKWGIGGAVVFPTLILLLAYYKDSFIPYPSVASYWVEQAFDFLTFPPAALDEVLPLRGFQYSPWVFWTSFILYLAALGFGIGLLLGKAVRFARNRSN